MKTCSICGEDKPAWCTYKECAKCHKSGRTSGVTNTRGEKVVVVESKQVIVVNAGRDGIWKTCLGHVQNRQYKIDGALTKYWNKIWINPHYSWTPETLAQTLSAESIHLAMFHLGFGNENTQFDESELALHSWNSIENMLVDYEGISITKHGLKVDG